MNTGPQKHILPTSPSPAKGFSFALAASVLIATNLILIKQVLGAFNIYIFSAILTGSGAVAALLTILSTNRPKLLLPPPKRVGLVVLIGIINGVMILSMCAGMVYLDPSLSALLLQFMPVVMLLFGTILLKEKLRPLELLPIGLMLVGGCICVAGRWEYVGVGVVLVMLAGVAAGLIMSLAKVAVSKGCHPNTIVLYRAGIGSLILFATAVVLGKVDFHSTPKFWALTLISGFIGAFLGDYLSFRSFRYWDLTSYSIVRMADPFFVVLISLLIFGTFPETKEVIGGTGIILGGLWLVILARK